MHVQLRHQNRTYLIMIFSSLFTFFIVNFILYLPVLQRLISQQHGHTAIFMASYWMRIGLKIQHQNDSGLPVYSDCCCLRRRVKPKKPSCKSSCGELCDLCKRTNHFRFHLRSASREDGGSLWIWVNSNNNHSSFCSVTYTFFFCILIFSLPFFVQTSDPSNVSF